MDEELQIGWVFAGMLICIVGISILTFYGMHYKPDICDIPIRNLTYNEMLQAEKECKR